MRKFLYVSGAVVAIAAIAFVSYRFMGRRKVDMSAVDFISRDDRTGVARVRSGKKWALIDKDNYMLTGFDYELMNEFVEKMTVMRKDGKFGMLDSKGKEAIRPEYSLVFSSRGGMSIVALDGKWGIVDNKGVEIVKPDYFDDITQFDVNNQARAVNYKDNVRVLLDMKGRIVKNLGKGKVPDALMYPTRAPAKAKPAAKVPEKAPAPAPAPAKKK